MSNKFRTIEFYEKHIIEYFAFVKNIFLEMLSYYNKNLFYVDVVYSMAKCLDHYKDGTLAQQLHECREIVTLIRSLIFCAVHVLQETVV